MSERTLVRNALDRLRERGVLNVVRHALHWLSERRHERRFGISTGTPIPLREFGYDDDHYVDYEAGAYRTLFRAFRHLRVDPGRSVFLDYGCGQGRALVVAATHPFRKVIGVDLVAELIAAAEENFERARPHLQCSHAELVRANAVDYVPPPEVDHIYLFNPFRGKVLGRVLDNIERSWRAAPRPLTIVYLNADDFETQVAGRDWLVRVERFRAYPETHAVIYRSREADTGSD